MTYKLIVAGSREMPREFTRAYVRAYVKSLGMPRLVLHGDCRGVDKDAGSWFKAKGIKVKPYPADWDRYGDAAGPKRNSKVVPLGDALLVIRFPDSVGSADILKKARRAGLHVVDVIVDRLHEE